MTRWEPQDRQVGQESFREHRTSILDKGWLFRRGRSLPWGACGGLKRIRFAKSAMNFPRQKSAQILQRSDELTASNSPYLEPLVAEAPLGTEPQSTASVPDSSYCYGKRLLFLPDDTDQCICP